jgi:hypothetical protein
MTKPVAAFRSGVIGDPRHTVRHIEADATGRDRVYGWLSVGYHVSGLGSRGRVGLVTPTPNGHLPALFGGPRPISRTTGGVDFRFLSVG